MRWIRNAAVLATTASVGLHLLMWFWAHFIVLGGAGGLGSANGPSAIGPAVESSIVTGTELASLQQQAIDVSTPSVSEPRPEEALSVAVEDARTGGGPGEGLGELPSIGPLTGAGDLTGSGEGLGGTGGGGGGASFFGVEAAGSRFVFVVDVSGSMDGPRLERLRLELRRSIEGLTESSQFMVIQFSDTAEIIGGERHWRDASNTGKRSARNQIELLRTAGGTNPLPAFEILTTLRPRPDAVYFMTDGEFGGVADDVIARIGDLTKSPKVPIHCICFGSNDGEAAMKRIARASHGTYTFVAGP